MILRIAITGGPKVGKTTLSSQLAIQHDIPTVSSTDDLIGTHDWSAASQAISEWFDAPGPWIVEGVAVSRALRKWRERNPGKPPPVDVVIYLRKPHELLTKGQETMAKGVDTVHREIAGWLAEHGVMHNCTVLVCNPLAELAPLAPGRTRSTCSRCGQPISLRAKNLGLGVPLVCSPCAIGLAESIPRETVQCLPAASAVGDN